MKRLAMLVAVSLCMAAAWAQPDPNQPAPQPEPPQVVPQPVAPPVPPVTAGNTAITVTPRGFFVLHAGMLAKYDAVTLQPQGAVRLLEPVPPSPVGGRPRPLPMPKVQADGGAVAGLMRPLPVEKIDAAALRKWQLANERMNAQPLVIATDEALLILEADLFFRVSQATLAIEARGELTEPEQPGQPMVYVYGGQAPVAQLHADTLFVVRGTHAYSVDARTGKLLGCMALPAEMVPAGMKPAIAVPLPTVLDGPVLNKGAVALQGVVE